MNAIPRWKDNPDGEFYVNIFKHEVFLDKYDQPYYEFGPPRATKAFTQQQLIARGSIGCFFKPKKNKKSESDDK